MRQANDAHTTRRTFMQGLATLPLIGGFAGLIGIGKAEAFDPTDPRILRAYKHWLHFESQALSEEMWPGYEDGLYVIPMNTGADCYHASWASNWREKGFGTTEPPSARAALVLKAVGIDPLRAIKRGL